MYLLIYLFIYLFIYLYTFGVSYIVSKLLLLLNKYRLENVKTRRSRIMLFCIFYYIKLKLKGNRKRSPPKKGSNTKIKGETRQETC